MGAVGKCGLWPLGDLNKPHRRRRAGNRPKPGLKSRFFGHDPRIRLRNDHIIKDWAKGLRPGRPETTDDAQGAPIVGHRPAGSFWTIPAKADCHFKGGSGQPPSSCLEEMGGHPSPFSSMLQNPLGGR
jgi:hypothetical protein